MDAVLHLSQLSRCPLTRRSFLKAGCGVCFAIGASRLTLTQEQARQPTLRLRVIFALHAPVQPGPDWPNVGFDFRPVMDSTLRMLRESFPTWSFEPAQASGPQQADEIVENDVKGGMDGFIVFQLNCWNAVVHSAVRSGKPTLYVDLKYAGSGGFLTYTANFLRSSAPNFAFLSSSDPADLIDAVRCFELIKGAGGVESFVRAVNQLRVRRTPPPSDRAPLPDKVRCIEPAECIRQLAQTRMIAVRGSGKGPTRKIIGIEVEEIPLQELNEAWDKTELDEARALASRWIAEAAQVVGVEEQAIVDGAKMYLAMQQLLKRYGAEAITIDCLGGFYSGQLRAYPCLGFYQLNNQGLVGGCECDVRSTAVMLLVRTLTGGRPGYISDPVLDSSRREIVYAHCVAPSKVFGPSGPANPYWIMTHSEDRKGASVRSLVPAGYLVTTLQIRPPEILIHRARVTGNDLADRACRTKICAEPLGDFERLYRFWDLWGWHRVTVYGDLLEPVQEWAKLMGWRVVLEA